MLGAAPAGRISPLILAAIAGAWLLAIVAQITGSGKLIHHDTLIEGSLPIWVALLLFVLAWQAMIAAMMLPSSLPLMRMFATASANQPNRGAVMTAFLGGYVAIWTLFGIAAFSGDIVVHRLVDRWSWLAAHPWLIAGGVLALAGIFQFSKLQYACLTKGRLPGFYLMQHYRRGTAAAFALGRDHGLFCVGCCWALMLVSFAAGFANLWWMAALTALMVYEKIGTNGKRIVPAVGVVLIIWAALIVAHPAWLPHALSGIS
jgi:predicted metal-binding membrane protein